MAQPEPATPAPVSTASVEGVCCAVARRRLDDEGITLALTESKDGILAGPKERLTAEVRSTIREAREGLIRELLFKEAVEYLQQHSPGFHEGGSSSDSEDYTRRREIADERLNDAWHEGDLEEFKQALRGWLKSQVRLLYNNSSSLGEPKESNGGPEENSAGEQPALM